MPGAAGAGESELQLLKLQREVAQQQRQLQEAQALLAHHDRQLAAMRRISDALFTHLSVDDMLRDTLSIAIEMLDADAGSFLLHNPTDDTLTFRHVIGPIADQVMGIVIPASAGIAGRVFRSGTPLLVDDTRAYPEQRKVEELVGYHAESMLSVPVRCAHGTVLGTMQILSSIHRFDPRDLEVLEVVSAVAAASIENARLAQERPARRLWCTSSATCRTTSKTC